MIFTLCFTRNFSKQLLKILPLSNIKSALCILSMVFFSSLSFGSDTHTQQAGTHYSALKYNGLLLASNELISADQAANIAKQGTDAKVLKISKKVQGNRDTYQIKLLTRKGHVRLILIDARTGEIVQGNK